MSGKINVGVIGYGLSAKIFHIPFINAVESFNLYAVVQRNPVPENDVRKDFPHTKLYASTEELVRDEQVHLVVVTTTPETHVELTTLALNAKKHVLVEKPFTPTSKEAEKLIELAKKQGVVLTVYQNRRYDADYLTLRRCIEEGRLGRVAEFETHFDRHRPDMPSGTWKATPSPGNTVVYDLGSHLMDQVINLYGAPKSITGFVGSQREHNNVGLQDSCTILLHYADGLLATIKAGVVSPAAKQLRFWVRGVQGSFKKFHMDPQEDQLRKGTRPGDNGYGIEPKERYAVVYDARDSQSTVIPTVEGVTYTRFYEQLAVAIQSDASQVPVETSQAVLLIRLIELAHKSSEERRTLDV